MKTYIEEEVYKVGYKNAELHRLKYELPKTSHKEIDDEIVFDRRVKKLENSENYIMTQKVYDFWKHWCDTNIVLQRYLQKFDKVTYEEFKENVDFLDYSRYDEYLEKAKKIRREKYGIFEN